MTRCKLVLLLVLTSLLILPPSCRRRSDTFVIALGDNIRTIDPIGSPSVDAASERVTVEYSQSTAPPSMVPRPAEPTYLRMDPPNATGTWTSSNCVVD